MEVDEGGSAEEVAEATTPWKEEEDALNTTRDAIGEIEKENEKLRSTLEHLANGYQNLRMHLFDVVHRRRQGEEVPIEMPTPMKPPKPPFYVAGGEMEELAGAAGDVSLSLGIASSSESRKDASEKPRETIAAAGAGEASQQNQQAQAKRTRVSVRTRCDEPTINDGCQWRKYGQKVSKGNPCPRAYYRCTVAPSCPVRKHVQRCAEDKTILITTYEGTHNHPLPVSAAGMASTTSAAAAMVMSGSTSSSPSTSASAGLNFASPASTSSQLYPQNPSLYSPPVAPSHPTITLDLTSQAASYSSSRTLNFSSPESNAAMNLLLRAQTSPLLTLGAAQAAAQPYRHRLQEIYGRPPQLLLTPMNVPPPPPALTSTQQVLTDSIAKAITFDPSFQTMLAAAITSYVDGGAGDDESPPPPARGKGPMDA